MRLPSNPLLLSIISAFCLGLPFLFDFLVPLIFLGFIPLMKLGDVLVRKPQPILYYTLYLFFTLLVWHMVGGVWLFPTGIVNIFIAFFINSLLLTLALLPSFIVRIRIGQNWGNLAFICSWISFELLHLNWELSFPLLIIGNTLASLPYLIQWYEFTGVLGGSLWVIGVNFTLVRLFEASATSSRIQFPLAQSIGIIILPMLVSGLISYNYQDKGKTAEVVSLHTTLDNYSEKYELSQDDLLNYYLAIVHQGITSKTAFVLWPESALTNVGWIEELEASNFVNVVRSSLANYPNAHLITGAILYKHYQPQTQKGIPALVGYSPKVDQYFYTHTCAIQVNAQDQTLHIRSKKKLVPFEETVPYPHFFNFVRTFSGSLGGFLFSSFDDKGRPFYTSRNFKTLPLICYESAYGAAFSMHIRKGAAVLFVLSNEGWYNNPLGSRAFFNLSRIRAIEFRRDVVRSTNFGRSGFINQRGISIKEVEGEVAQALTGNVKLNTNKTFYTIYGDYLGYLAIMGMVITLIRMILKQQKRSLF